MFFVSFLGINWLGFWHILICDGRYYDRAMQTAPQDATYPSRFGLLSLFVYSSWTSCSTWKILLTNLWKGIDQWMKGVSYELSLGKSMWVVFVGCICGLYCVVDLLSFAFVWQHIICFIHTTLSATKGDIPMYEIVPLGNDYAPSIGLFTHWFTSSGEDDGHSNSDEETRENFLIYACSLLLTIVLVAIGWHRRGTMHLWGCWGGGKSLNLNEGANKKWNHANVCEWTTTSTILNTSHKTYITCHNLY